MNEREKLKPRRRSAGDAEAMNTNFHECGFLEKLLDGAEVEWKALGEGGEAIYNAQFTVHSSQFSMNTHATNLLTSTVNCAL